LDVDRSGAPANVKREETRRRKIEEYVAMLARGETIHPQRASPD
jgi:uncharacterized protein YdeI (YjbR/CyaY-like superfamily)